MSREQLIVGLDIGSHTIKTAIAKIKSEDENLQIIGVFEVPSSGIRKGCIVDIESVKLALQSVIEKAEILSGKKIKTVYVGFSGIYINTCFSRGIVAVSRANQEISEDDIARVLNAAEAVSLPPNREIIHVIPREYIIDGEGRIKNPLGMKGIRLELNALIINGISPFIKNIHNVLEEVGLEVEELIFGNLALAKNILNKKQKELGSVCVDIGGEISGMTVFEEGDVIHTAVLPIGSAHITNDIAIGLRVPIEIAEQIKINCGNCLNDSAISKKDQIDLTKIFPEGLGGLKTISKKILNEIIEARFTEIFDLVNKELKKISRQGLLPGGIVLTGGGSKMEGILEFAKQELKIPAIIGTPQFDDISMIEEMKNPSYSTVFGIIHWAKEILRKKNGGQIFTRKYRSSIFKKILWWVEDFLP